MYSIHIIYFVTLRCVTIEATKCFYFQYIDNIKNFIKNGFASHPSYAHPHFAGSSIKFLPHLDLAVELSINADSSTEGECSGQLGCKTSPCIKNNLITLILKYEK